MKVFALTLFVAMLLMACQDTGVVFKWRLRYDDHQVLETHVWYKGEHITTYLDYEDPVPGCNRGSVCFVPLIDSAVVAGRHAQGMALINELKRLDKLTENENN
jgi:hypothetical protein